MRIERPKEVESITERQAAPEERKQEKEGAKVAKNRRRERYRTF